MPLPNQPNAGPSGPGRAYRSSGGIPDGLVVGVLVLLLGTVTLFWLATALAGLVTTGRLPHPLPFLETPSAIRHLATAPNDLPAAWPGTPAPRLPSATAFWVTFFVLLALLATAVLSVAISLTRLRLRTRARAEEDGRRPGDGPADGVPADGYLGRRGRPEAGGHPVDGRRAPRRTALDRQGSPGEPSPAPPAQPPPPTSRPPAPQSAATQPSGAPAPPSAPAAPSIPRPATEPVPAEPAASGGGAEELSTTLWKTPGGPGAAGAPAAAPRLRLGPGSSCLFMPAANPAKRPLLGATLREHRGPALVLTSAGTAAALPQRAPHAATGGLLFDPLRLLPDEEAAELGLTRLRWAPHTGCDEPAVATARAAALLAPLRPPHRPALSTQSRAQLPSHLSAAAAHDTARTMLRCWLHAAALDGRPIRQVHRWATGHQAQDAVRILRTTTSRRVADGWGGELEAALTTHPELRESAQNLVRAALAVLAELHVLQSCTPGSPNEQLEVESFLREGGILYVAGPASERRITPEHGSVMPLLTALAEDVVEHGRSMAARSPSGRLDPPLLCLLDDVAAVAPLPSLPELLDRGGALGLPTVAVLRSPEQARARWGADAAHSLWTRAETRVLLGSTDPAALAPLLAEFAPEAPVPGAGEALVLRQGQPPALAALPAQGTADRLG